MGSRGFLWVWIMGSKNVTGLDYGSNISEVTANKRNVLEQNWSMEIPQKC